MFETSFAEYPKKMKKYEVLKLIGKGGFSKVLLGNQNIINFFSKVEFNRKTICYEDPTQINN